MKGFTQQEIVHRYLKRRALLSQTERESETPGSNSSQNATHSEKFLAVAMGTHFRLGDNSPLRLIDFPQSGLIRAIALSAVTIQVPEQVSSLHTALSDSCKLGLPVQISAGFFSIGCFTLHEASCAHPLILRGAGITQTFVACSWELRGVAAIFEDLTLLQGESIRHLTDRLCIIQFPF